MCLPAWSRACNHSCHLAQECPERTDASEGRGRQVTSPMRRHRSGEGGQGPSSLTDAEEP
jgi:hypothetical protein